MRGRRILGVTHHYTEPSWLPDGSGALIFDPLNVLTANVVAARPGAPDTSPWLHDFDTKHPAESYWKPIGAGELSPTGHHLALLRGGTHTGDGGQVHAPSTPSPSTTPTDSTRR